MGWKIYLPDGLRPEGRNFLQNQGHELIDGNGEDMLQMMREVRDADAIITAFSAITPEIMRAGKKLKAIGTMGSGYATVDHQMAASLGIRVVSAPEASVPSTVEMTIFYMLYLSRRMTAVRRDYLDDFNKARENEDKQELWNKTVGIVGCGRIGSRVAKICKNAFHMKVLAYDPYKPASEFPLGVVVERSLDHLLSESDIVSLHMFPRIGSEYQFGMEHFRKMKDTAYFINTVNARAIREKDLYEACRDGVIAGAALDGLSRMPFDQEDPFLYLENVLITPHMSTMTREARTRAALQAAMGIQELYEGKQPTWEVREPDWKKMTVYHDTGIVTRRGIDDMPE